MLCILRTPIAKSIWSDGETLSAGDDAAAKVFAYELWVDPGTEASEYVHTRPWQVDFL